MSQIFNEEINKLNEELEKMGRLVCKTIENSFQAFKNYDLELARKVVDGDNLVDSAEKAVEARALRLLSLTLEPDQLRVISTALKVITDMERIGDQAADIAEILLFYKKGPMKSDLSNIFDMADIAVEMVSGSVECMINRDVGTASRIIGRDDAVDSLFGDVRDCTIELLTRDRSLADEAVDMIMIAKYLERIADHATNIAEWAIYLETGKK